MYYFDVTTTRMYSSISKGYLEQPDVGGFLVDVDTDKGCKATFPSINCTWSLCVREVLHKLLA